MHDGVLLDISNLWHLSDTSDDGVGETTGVPLHVTVVDLTTTDGPVGEEGVFLVNGLEEVEVVVDRGRVEVVLQRDDVRVVEGLVGLLSLEGVERGERERRPLPWDIMGSR